MLKALIRKQLLEIRASLSAGKRWKGKAAGKAAAQGMIIFLIIIYIVLMGGVFGLCMLLGPESLFSAGLDWIYFTILTAMAFVLGIFGSVLSTANAVFRSKDNELLLSMPIAPWKIVFVRMISVYITGLLYAVIIMVPAVVCYFIFGSPSFGGVILSILSCFILGFLIAAFSCGFGWIAASVSARLKNQKILGVILIIILIGIIYYFQFNASRFFKYLAEIAPLLAENAHSWRYPVFAPGLGMTGDLPAFLIFTAITAVLFGLAYFAMSKGFSKIALAKYTEKNKGFSVSDIRAQSAASALFRREIKRFTSSVPYMLNCGLGIVLLLAGAAVLIIKADSIGSLAIFLQDKISSSHELTAVGLTQAVCMVTAFCTMASCAISMEGRSIGILRSMPVYPYQLFMVKILTHVMLTGIPAFLCTAAAGISVRAGTTELICMIVYVFMYIVLCAFFELRSDVKHPLLDWTNENQVLKTRVSVLGITFAVMLFPVPVFGIYFLIRSFFSVEMFLVIFTALYAALSLLINRQLKRTGWIDNNL